MHPEEKEELKNKRICYVCVNEAYLSKEIESEGEVAKCSYCDENVSTYSIGAVTERIETAFEQHYYRTSEYPDDMQQMIMADKEINYVFERYGMPTAYAIEDAASLPSEAAQDIQKILGDDHSSMEADQMGEETPFSTDAHYSERDTKADMWEEEWRQFEASLKTEGRFFNRAAAAHLGAVFGGIDKLKTVYGYSLVADVGPGCKIDHLYRARVFQSDSLLLEALCRPDLYLGSPPADRATAGRMNAHGISVFYGADKADVAIAEVRPPVGSKVAVAKFEIVRPLRVLDLTALPDVYESGSIFDPTSVSRLERAAFLQSLGKWMTRPVMPGDEGLDYLATQAVADFLATENDPVLDGIIFPSVQAEDGRNIVLFHRAAGVEQLEIPAGTKISASAGHVTSDGWEPDYTVFEAVPATQKATGLDDWNTPFLNPAIAFPGDLLLAGTLRIDAKSVTVHHVAWVRYHCTKFAVDRHRHQQPESSPDFSGPLSELEF